MDLQKALRIIVAVLFMAASPLFTVAAFAQTTTDGVQTTEIEDDDDGPDLGWIGLLGLAGLLGLKGRDRKDHVVVDHTRRP